MSGLARLAVALLFTGASLAACSDHALDEPELQRVSLPGFSIELPAGQVTATSKEGFAGSHNLRLPDPGLLRRLPFATDRRREAVVRVSWSQHGLSQEKHNALLRDMSLDATPNSRIVRQATPAPEQWVLTIAGSQGSATFASRSCEPGFSIDLVVGVNDRADEDFGLASKILDSVRCSLTDANRQRPEPATRLPSNFGRVLGATTTKYVSLAGEGLLIEITAGDVSESSQFESVMRALVSQSFGVPVREVSTTEIKATREDNRKQRLLRAKIPTGDLYVGTLWCPSLSITLITTYTSPQPEDTRGREVFDAVYCPGEVGESAPDARTLLKNGCDSGSSTACETLHSAYP